MNPPDFPTPTEASLFLALHRTYGQGPGRNSHACAPHVPGGYEHNSHGVRTAMRVIDALVLLPNGRRWAVEIKVTAADLRLEVSHPAKSEPWRRTTHGFYLLVPTVLVPIALAEAPRPWGVLVADSPAFGTRIARRSALGPGEPLDDRSWTAMARGYGREHAVRLEANALQVARAMLERQN